MSLRVNCPSCQMPCQVADEHLGKAIRCPGCKQPFSIRRPAPALSPVPPPPPPEVLSTPPTRFLLSTATSPGRLRDRNEDSLLVQHLKWAGQSGRHEAILAVVADGMGGHEAGDRASAVAISSIASALAPRLAGLVGDREPFEDDESILDALDHALWEANRAIAQVAEQDSACEGMGATVVAALVIGASAAICHVGDCRAYLWRDGSLECKTRDQTVVNRMVELGMLSEKEAKTHSAASQVTQALGRQYELEPSRVLIQLVAGDRLVLACDGLHAHREIPELRERIGANRESADLAGILVRDADEAGGSDNCTVIVIRAE